MNPLVQRCFVRCLVEFGSVIPGKEQKRRIDFDIIDELTQAFFFYNDMKPNKKPFY